MLAAASAVSLHAAKQISCIASEQIDRPLEKSEPLFGAQLADPGRIDRQREETR
jgi:hypothetical protein